MLLLDRTYMSIKNNWVDKYNKAFIYYTQAEAMKVLKFGSSKTFELFRELDENGLIFRVKQGLRKPDLIYVKNLSKLEVKDDSFDGEFKYPSPNIEHCIDNDTENLFINSITFILTNKKYKNCKHKILLNDLFLMTSSVYINAKSNSEIKYPISYMSKCILNILDTNTINPKSNKSNDLQACEEMLNTTPSFI